MFFRVYSDSPRIEIHIKGAGAVEGTSPPTPWALKSIISGLQHPKKVSIALSLQNSRLHTIYLAGARCGCSDFGRHPAVSKLRDFASKRRGGENSAMRSAKISTDLCIR